MNKKPARQDIENFRALSREYSDASILMHEAIARKAGLTGTDHKYLGLLVENGPMTAGVLSKATGLTTGAVTGLIDRFEKKKLARREYDKDDRRKVIIVANTQNIMKLLEPIFAGLQEKTIRMLTSFSKEEIGVIEKYFSAAIRIMNEVKESINHPSKARP